MKTFRGTLAFGVGLVLSFNLHAQTFSSAQSIQSIGEAQPDSIVCVTAEAQGLTRMAPEDLPFGGTYWWALPGGGIVPMPFPQDVNNPIYQILPGIFLEDTTGGQVVVNTHRLGSHTATISVADVLAAEAQAVVNLIGQVQEAQSSPELVTATGLASANKFSPSGGGMMPMFSLISSPGNNQVYLANLVETFTNGGVTVAFSIAGGTNGFAYDIYRTRSLADSPVYSQWTWLGQGYTSNRYTFTNQPSDYAFYTLAIPRQTMVVAWGDDSNGQCDVPAGLTNVIDVAAGFNFSLALKADSTVVAWGDNTYGETTVPAGLTNVTSIAAGGAHVLALLQNGTVTAWGDNGVGQTNVPAGLTNVTAIAAGDACSLALRSDGMVVAWGYNYYGQTNVPALGPVSQIAAGVVQGVASLTNGTVTQWGNFNGSPFGWTGEPAGLSNVVSVAAGACHTLALNANGTVTAWGAGATYTGLNNDGQSIVPAGLSNVVAVAGGYLYSMALQSAGTVVAWGDDLYGETDMPDRLTGVKAISAGGFHGLALRSGSLTPVISEEPVNQYAIPGATVTFSTYGEGVAGVSYQWQFDGVNIMGATGANLTLTNVQTTADGSYRAIISNSAGFVTSDSAILYVYPLTPPVITSQTLPTNPVCLYGTNLSLGITATAPLQTNGFPFSYQWQFNGANLGGATASNHTFSVFYPGTYSVTVTNAVGSATTNWQVFIDYTGSYIASNTLAYHLSTNAVGYASGYSGSSTNETEVANWTSALYSSAYGNMVLLTNATWSTNFWLKGVRGLSATPIGTSNSPGGQTLITMVSPRHYLRASHTGGLSGMTAFLDTNNVIYWRTAVQQVGIDNDTSIGILNADLPPSVGFLMVIPTNFSSYLPTNSTSYVQGIGMNQDMRLFGQPMTFGDPVDVDWNPLNTAPFGLATNWNVTIRIGDSSNPEMFLIGNQLVLVTHNFQPPDGPNYAYQINAINQQMHYLSTNNAVGTDYQLTQFSLTNWPTIH